MITYSDISNKLNLSTSLLKKHLTESVYSKLKCLKTDHQFTFQQAIQSGIDHPDSHVGIYAGDQESYKLFSPIFNPIIKAYHNFSETQYHKSNVDLNGFLVNDLDPTRQYIISTRIRVARNLDSFPLGTCISNHQRNTIEKNLIEIFQQFSGSFKGTYTPLLKLDDRTQDQLISDHVLFKKGDRFLESAGLNRDWPYGRGIFSNQERNFFIWVNEEDHLRIISMQKGGDILAVFSRLIEGLNYLQSGIKFCYDERLGYITSCPSNLGTALRASVHIRLPHLGSSMERFQRIVDEYDLQIRGTQGEHSESENHTYDISNKHRLGFTEVELVQQLCKGVKTLIEVEKNLTPSTH